MDIKLISLDLDGTLMNSDHISISEKNIETIKKAHKSGVEFIIATGRSYAFCKDILLKLPYIRYGIFSNGAYVVDLNKQIVLDENLMSVDEGRHVVDVLKSHKLSCLAFYNGKSYIQKGSKIKNPYVSSSFINLLYSNCIEIDNFYDRIAKKQLEKFDIYGINESKQKKVESEILGNSNILITSSLPCVIELNSIYANKGVALEHLLNHLNLNAQNVMAFGDSGNDCQMLSYVKWPVAMGNGIESVKKLGKIIAPSNDESGVSEVIEKYILT